ncbi:hypothetical protein, partial [Micromonospora arida]|uniref:hypothetical protein n=1 Tax=Micromonospora arida TaxID=2203715 RepID=UPI0033DC2B45
LNSSTPQPEAFTYLRHQIVSSHNLDQPPWTAQLEPAGRARLAAAIAARAENFQPPYRQFVEDAPEAFGLLNEDD